MKTMHKSMTQPHYIFQKLDRNLMDLIVFELKRGFSLYILLQEKQRYLNLLLQKRLSKIFSLCIKALLKKINKENTKNYKILKTV